MPTLHLGVIDVPYQQRRGRGAKRSAATTTTADVAGWLEDKYHPIEIFYHENEDAIAEALTQSLVDALEAGAQGAPLTLDPFGAATTQIENKFKSFLALQELDKLGVPGIPTKAAQEGRSSRFKTKKGGAPRASLIDTGLYQSSFKAWVDADGE